MDNIKAKSDSGLETYYCYGGNHESRFQRRDCAKKTRATKALYYCITLEREYMGEIIEIAKTPTAAPIIIISNGSIIADISLVF